LREKLEPYISAYTWRYFSFRGIFNFKIILNFNIKITLIFGGNGKTLNELNAFDTLVSVIIK
jgi:hypothetical protein